LNGNAFVIGTIFLLFEDVIIKIHYKNRTGQSL
jgi:hypothetical protein